MAADACCRAVALRPQFPEAHANPARALGRSGRFDVAIKAYRTAIELTPGDVTTRLGLADQRAAAGRPVDAMSVAEDAPKRAERARAVAAFETIGWQLAVYRAAVAGSPTANPP